MSSIFLSLLWIAVHLAAPVPVEQAAPGETAPTIAGIIYGADGSRLAGASVSAYRVQYTPYGRQLVSVATVLSHEGGEYRLFHLTPGYYFVMASYSERSIHAWKSVLMMTPNLSNPDEGYASVYFPDAPNTAGAKLLNLNSGAAEHIDISFRETQFFSLKIKLILPPTPPGGHRGWINPRVALFPAGTDLEKAQDYALKGSGPDFEVERLAEGEYVAVALADFLNESGKMYSAAISDTMHIRLDKNGRNDKNMDATIVAMEPFDIFGNIFRSVNTTLPNRMQVQLVRVDPFAQQTFVASVDTSGQFRLRDVGPGTYDVFLQGMPRNAYLQEARLPSANQSPVQIRIDADLPTRTWVEDRQRLIVGWVSDAVMTLSYRGGSSVSGVVVDGKGSRIPRAEIVLVPTDPRGRMRRDRHGVGVSDASGAFLLQGIPPDSYVAYAFESIETDIYFDAKFNAALAALGTPVIVTAGINRPMDRALTIITKDDLARITR